MPIVRGKVVNVGDVRVFNGPKGEFAIKTLAILEDGEFMPIMVKCEGKFPVEIGKSIEVRVYGKPYSGKSGPGLEYIVRRSA